MSTNQEVVSILQQIADLLDLAGERFKPEAYRRAARSIEALAEDLRSVAARGELRSVPGVGEAIEEKIEEYLRDGKVAYLERIQKEVPPGILQLMHLPGTGPKTARRLHVELGIDGPQGLLSAIDSGRLTAVKGFGPKKIGQLRQAVAGAATGTAEGSRHELLTAWGIARSIIDRLSSLPSIDRIEAAGSLRRRRETIGDLDLLVTSPKPEEVFDAFSALPGIQEIKLRGGTKETVLYSGGFQVDLRVVEPMSFGAALQYFTGSKDHNIRLRTLARDRGLKINEYGVFRDDRRIGGATEEEVYRIFDLPWIPPEIRENQGELEAAAKGKLPRLIELDQIRGDLHVHVAPDTTDRALAGLLDDVQRRGWSYVGLVASRAEWRREGIEPEKVVDRWKAFASQRRGPGPLVWVGEEVTHASGSRLPAPARGFDFWTLRPGDGLGRFVGFPDLKVDDPRPLYLAHVTSLGEDTDRKARHPLGWLARLRELDIGVDVTPRPSREGPDSVTIRRLVEVNSGLYLSAGADGTTDLSPMELAVGLARRGWATAGHVRNTLPPESLNGVPRSSARKSRA